MADDSSSSNARTTEDNVITDRGARRAFAVVTVLGTIVGLLLGYCWYGSLASVRAWNVYGLVLITFIFVYGLIVGIRAWSNQCAIFREEENAAP